MSARALFVGLSTLDIAYLVDRYPSEDSKTSALDQFMAAGGPAANASVAYASLTARTATLITALGTHHLTTVVRDDLHSHGVHTVDVTVNAADQLPLSSIVVAQEAHTRTIVSLDAARIGASYDDSLAGLLDEARIVLTDGHFGELSLGIAKEAQARKIPVVLDAGRWKDSHAELLGAVDIAICSSAFAPPGVSEEPDAVLEYLLAAGPRQAAITRGAESITVSTANGVGKIPIQTSQRTVDTLGAGDILHGAFCYFHADRALPFADALERAAQVASASCQYFGTREWINHLDDVDLS